MAKKGIIVKIPVWIAEKNYLQGLGGWSESEIISCQTAIFMHAIPLPLLRFVWETQKVI